MPKILVIDDDPAIVELLRMTLSEGGHSVIESGEAVEAVALAASELPDLITLDVHMPAVDGIEIYRRLRANAANAKTPIIFLTGGSPADVLDRIPTDSRVSFIDKPIDMDLLARMVVEFTGYPERPA